MVLSVLLASLKVDPTGGERANCQTVYERLITRDELEQNMNRYRLSVEPIPGAGTDQEAVRRGGPCQAYSAHGIADVISSMTHTTLARDYT